MIRVKPRMGCNYEFQFIKNEVIVAQSSLLLFLSSTKKVLKVILSLDSFPPPSSLLLLVSFIRTPGNLNLFSYRGSRLFLETPEKQLHGDEETDRGSFM